MTDKDVTLEPFSTTSPALADEIRGEPAGMPSLERLGAVKNVPVQLSVVLGRTSMPVSQLLRLGRGAVVQLDRKVGEPIDIYVNNRLVARGEVMITDGHLGVTLTEIVRGER